MCSHILQATMPPTTDPFSHTCDPHRKLDKCVVTTAGAHRCCLNLGALAPDTAGELNILRHDCHTLRVDGAQLDVFEEAYQVSLGRLYPPVWPGYVTVSHGCRRVSQSVAKVSQKCHKSFTEVSQKCRRSVIKCHVNVAGCHSVTTVSQNRHKVSQKCHKVSQKCRKSVTKCRKMSQNVTKCQTTVSGCHQPVNALTL